MSYSQRLTQKRIRDIAHELSASMELALLRSMEKPDVTPSGAMVDWSTPANTVAALVRRGLVDNGPLLRLTDVGEQVLIVLQRRRISELADQLVAMQNRP